jgi:hypothetical protein
MTHADSCGSPPAYNDYGSSPHTDSCYNITQYADSGGLPLCPSAFQGSFHINNACHSNTAFGDFNNYNHIPYDDYLDNYQQWTDYHTDVCTPYSDSGTHSNYCSNHIDDYYQATSCSGGQYFGNQGCWANVACSVSHQNYSVTTYDKHIDGYMAYTNSTTPGYSNACYTHNNHEPAAHVDYYANVHNTPHTNWTNYIHTSHINFCNHSDSNIGPVTCG